MTPEVQNTFFELRKTPTNVYCLSFGLVSLCEQRVCLTGDMEFSRLLLKSIMFPSGKNCTSPFGREIIPLVLIQVEAATRD